MNFQGLEPYADILKDIYGDLAKPSVQKVGIALSAVFGLGVTIMWPLMLLNERARIALESNLQKYSEKLEDVPSDEITVVPPEVAMPILEKLSYVTNEHISELYIELLAKASTKGENNLAHPSFVNILNSISPDEALILNNIQGIKYLPYVRIVAEISNMRIITVEDLVVLFSELQLVFPQNIKAYISNLASFGIFEIMPNSKLQDEMYVEHKKYFDLKHDSLQKSNHSSENNAKGYRFDKGTIAITDFGELFLSAIKS